MTDAAKASEVTRLIDHLSPGSGATGGDSHPAFARLLHLHLADDVVQDSMARCRCRPGRIPRAAKSSALAFANRQNRAFDHTRRSTLWRGKQAELVLLVEDCAQAALTVPPPQFEDAETPGIGLHDVCLPGQPGPAAGSTGGADTPKRCAVLAKRNAAAFLTGEAAVTKLACAGAPVSCASEGWRWSCHRRAESGRARRYRPAGGSVFVQRRLLGYLAGHCCAEDLCLEATRLGELLSAHPVGQGLPRTPCWP